MHLHAYYLDYDMTTLSTTCTNTEDIKIKMLASVQGEREGKERTKMIISTHTGYTCRISGAWITFSRIVLRSNAIVEQTTV
jgi:hypothetical protein